MYKALYLLAGSGTRLFPYTESMPKALIDINGRPLLSRSVDSMIACGIDRFVVVTGYRAESVHRFFRENYPGLAVEFIHSERYAETNNAYSLWLAQGAFTGDGMILMDGDILYQHQIAELMLTPSGLPNALAVRGSNDLGEEEIKVMLNGKGEVTRIGKTLNSVECYGESIGIARFSPVGAKRLFQTLSHRIQTLGLEGEFYEASFQQMIDEGERIGIVDTLDYRCIEIDTPDDLRMATEEVVAYIDGEKVGE